MRPRAKLAWQPSPQRKDKKTNTAHAGLSHKSQSCLLSIPAQAIHFHARAPTAVTSPPLLFPKHPFRTHPLPKHPFHMHPLSKHPFHTHAPIRLHLCSECACALNALACSIEEDEELMDQLDEAHSQGDGELESNERIFKCVGFRLLRKGLIAECLSRTRCYAKDSEERGSLPGFKIISIESD